jgi:peptide/nickel transport system permease protein
MSVAGAELPLRRRRGMPQGIRGQGMLFTGAIVVLAALVAVAVLAPLLAPYDPTEVSLSDSYAPAGLDHLLGADQSGRDTLSRLIYGARTSLLGPLGVVVASTLAGGMLGVLAAWRGGWLDTALSRALELVFAFPGLLVAILSVAVFGPGLTAPVIAMGIAYKPYIARVARSVALQERQRPYIAAYSVGGFSGWAVCLRHLVPNIAPVVLAQATLNFGYALMDLAALSFLGLGVQPPDADWGTMVSEGQDALLSGITLPAIAPGIAIVLTVVAFNVVGEGIADRLARRDRR